MIHSYLKNLSRDLEAPIETRGFGTGWFAGFFALLFSGVALCFVVASRWPGFFSMPELAVIEQTGYFRIAIHVLLIAG